MRFMNSCAFLRYNYSFNNPKRKKYGEINVQIRRRRKNTAWNDGKLTASTVDDIGVLAAADGGEISSITP